MKYIFMFAVIIGVATMFLSVLSYNKKHDLLVSSISNSRGIENIRNAHGEAQRVLNIHFYITILGLFLMAFGLLGGILYEVGL